MLSGDEVRRMNKPLSLKTPPIITSRASVHFLYWPKENEPKVSAFKSGLKLGSIAASRSHPQTENRPIA